MVTDNEKLERVERLLRSAGPALLRPDFERRVMAQLRALPDPTLLALPTRVGWRGATALLGPGELIALACVLLGLTGLLLPAARGWLTAVQLELSDLTLSISLGDAALSASVLSLLALALGAALLTAAGTFAARSRLIGA